MGECLQTLQGHTDYVNSIIYLPDKDQIVSCSDDNTLKIWSATTGECLQTLQGHTDSVFSVIYIPDKDQLVSCSRYNTLIIWDFTLDMFLTEVFCLSMIPPPPFPSDNKSNKKRKVSELERKRNILDDNLIR